MGDVSCAPLRPEDVDAELSRTAAPADLLAAVTMSFGGLGLTWALPGPGPGRHGGTVLVAGGRGGRPSNRPGHCGQAPGPTADTAVDPARGAIARYPDSAASAASAAFSAPAVKSRALLRSSRVARRRGRGGLAHGTRQQRQTRRAFIHGARASPSWSLAALGSTRTILSSFRIRGCS